MTHLFMLHCTCCMISCHKNAAHVLPPNSITQWDKNPSEFVFILRIDRLRSQCHSVVWQGMRQHGCSGCTNPQIFGISPFALADFETSSTMCARCIETKSSPGCTCTRRSKILTHFLSGKSYESPKLLGTGKTKAKEVHVHQCSLLQS